MELKEDKIRSNIDFKLTSLMISIRDFIRPRENVLKEVNIEPGFRVLDFGCGPGSYSVCAARLVGRKGKIYAADIHPLAIESVTKRAKRAGLNNIETIQTNCKTRLPDNCIDVVFLYDVFHGFGEPERFLKEFHRVLKPGGVLSFSDHHLKGEKIIQAVTGSSLFKLANSNKHTFSFKKS
ncbi:MAG: class I SAM-dependent methyltransferase [Deltaproteobacteria bacterium]|uniref:Class I SAM-dependent methyltransferase n=1 Tax=Candidatus Zymogenus saltonus TaxID=2844893 RepID=A0A9D8KH10_9DELT|nr:class I SAM-dependent methyltransferase [Candidatus Zymogenus saltonus]